MNSVVLQLAIGVAAFLFICFTGYVWRLNHVMSRTPPQVEKLAAKRFTTEEIRECYKKVQESPTDVKPYLFPARNRRYVVTGGSGLVGGWIVQHLLWRGEDPAAIRILDLVKPTRPEVAENNVQFIKTDVSDAAAVSEAFNAPWSPKVADLPLTVFHTVAFIKAHLRKADFLPLYEKINVQGTQNVLNSAKAAGSDCFILTSSCSVAIRQVNFFFWPWKSGPDDFVQVAPNADPKNPDGGLDDFGACYSYSKMRCENLVRRADSKEDGFRTGCLRPGHAIYGHGVNNPSSFTYTYLSRGGFPVWLHPYVLQFVCAQNVSIAHLAYENTLLNDPNSPLGGRAYFCGDPGPPIFYGELYKVLATACHPKAPCKFPEIPPAPVMMFAYLNEAYHLLRHRYLPFLPELSEDITVLQPAIMFMSSIYMVYDDSLAKKEIGYNPPIGTLEGLCHQVLYYNDQVDARLKAAAEAKGGGVGSTGLNSVPAAMTA